MTSVFKRKSSSIKSQNVDELSIKLEKSSDQLYMDFQIFQNKMKELSQAKSKMKAKDELMIEKLDKMYNFNQQNKVKLSRYEKKIEYENKQQLKLEQELLRVHLVTEKVKLKFKFSTCFRWLSWSTPSLLKRQKLQNAIAHHRKYATFLQKVVDLLPSDYVKLSKDNSLNGIMHRFNSLFLVSDVLYKVNLDLLESLKSLHNEVLESQSNKLVQFISSNTEYLRQIDITHETDFLCNKSKFCYFARYFERRKKIHDFGVLLLSIDNITNKCINQFKYFDTNYIQFNFSLDLNKMKVVEKFEHIYEFIQFCVFLMIDFNKLRQLEHLQVNEQCKYNAEFHCPNFR